MVDFRELATSKLSQHHVDHQKNTTNHKRLTTLQTGQINDFIMTTAVLVGNPATPEKAAAPDIEIPTKTSRQRTVNTNQEPVILEKEHQEKVELVDWLVELVV